MSAAVSLLVHTTLSLRVTLREYVSKQAPGATLDYVSVSQATGVDMSPGANGKWGRRALADAARAEGREYIRLHGIGVRLLSGVTGADAIQDALLDLSKRAAKTEKRSERIVEKLGPAMSEADRARSIAMTSFLTTVKMSASLNAKVPAPQLKK